MYDSYQPVAVNERQDGSLYRASYVSHDAGEPSYSYEVKYCSSYEEYSDAVYVVGYYADGGSDDCESEDAYADEEDAEVTAGQHQVYADASGTKDANYAYETPYSVKP